MNCCTIWHPMRDQWQLCFVQQTRYEVQSSSFAPLQGALNQSGYMETTTNWPDSDWTHTLKIGLVRSTNQTLSITDVSVVYGFFGNIGGAYALLKLCFGLFFAVTTPAVTTKFRMSGVSVMPWVSGFISLMSKCCSCCAPQRFQRLTFGQAAKLPEVQSLDTASSSPLDLDPDSVVDTSSLRSTHSAYAPERSRRIRRTLSST